MKINQILAGLKQEKTAAAAAPAEKTASEKKPETTTAPRAALVAALEKATTPAEKSASENKPAAAPVEDLRKLASELAEQEKQAALADATRLGEAFMDGAIARLGVWEKAAAEMNTAPVTQEQLKQAAEYGYQQAHAELEKLAQAEYDDGWNETVNAIFKTAADEFAKAAQVTAALLAK